MTDVPVTNAALHAQTEIGLSVTVAEGTLEVDVADNVPRLRRPRYQAGQQLPQPQWFDENGRGLLIVEALADEWGISEEQTGKRVWFRLAVEETWPYNATCSCRGSDLRNPVVLPYGRRVEHVGGPWDH